MRHLLLLSIVFIALSSKASGPRFWAEPFLSYSSVANFEEGSEKGSGDGYGGGLQLFGFFTQNLYLGVVGRYDLLKFNMDTGASISAVEGTLLSGGPLLGFFSSRFRVWGSYLLLDQFDQKHASGSTNFETKKTGAGLLVGAGFWVWPKFVIGVEYLSHSFDEFEQTVPSASSGTLTNKLKVDQIVVNFQFPFEL